MIELTEKQYEGIRAQVEYFVGVEESDDFFYNTLAYLTPNAIVLRDKTVIPTELDDMVETIAQIITEGE